MSYRITRSANGRQWNVVDSTGYIVEGGFFSKQAAVDCAKSWNDEEERENDRLLGDAPGFQDFPPQYR